MNRLPWHTKIVLALLAFLPVYFVVAALGTKFGVWSWQTGLLALTFGGGVILLGLTALAALVSLIIAARAKPRNNGLLAAAIIGLLLPGAIFVMFTAAGAKAGENPIHDISTDTANPPAFSDDTLARREAAGANPLSDYQTPLGELEPFKQGISPQLAVKSHAQIITDRKDRPAPLPLGGASKEDGVAAVAAAMGNMGLKDIRTDVAAGRVEGVAETFWFGFKDDVIARVGDQQIDFRSVSRVGQSDLGANTARIAELRKQTEALLGAASRGTPPAP
ncbi:DUF1499 domain-containing protein [Erythrobacter sp. sf7]|uniref:DUF1499 domain-containing protein n=1 Tax=Erythrobacter fulvus TaxID=2987523 RepID=A0ABT5JNF7_9SPHN|nr:DUF1499 domain-containing protein [Erythrobacter fulvus]MDC8754313.1 DUF1499 domain-containing protein [Erythrobacter fulvus]